MEKIEWTEIQKSKFLLKRGWKKIRGFVVDIEPAEDDMQIFVPSKEFFDAVRKGEGTYYTLCGEIITDLDEAFESELYNFISEKDTDDEEELKKMILDLIK